MWEKTCWEEINQRGRDAHLHGGFPRSLPRTEASGLIIFQFHTAKNVQSYYLETKGIYCWRIHKKIPATFSGNQTGNHHTQDEHLTLRPHSLQTLDKVSKE